MQYVIQEILIPRVRREAMQYAIQVQLPLKQKTLSSTNVLINPHFIKFYLRRREAMQYAIPEILIPSLALSHCPISVVMDSTSIGYAEIVPRTRTMEYKS